MPPTFDPVLIIAQIVSLQCFYYIGLGTVLGVFHAIFETSVSLDHFFTPRYIHLSTIEGLSELFCFIVASLIGAWLLSIVVERSKKCVDFTFTLYFLHVIFCSYYGHFPLEWEWWVVQCITSVVMASVGEYLCARKELEDIPLYSNNSTIKDATESM